MTTPPNSTPAYVSPTSGSSPSYSLLRQSTHQDAQQAPRPTASPRTQSPCPVASAAENLLSIDRICSPNIAQMIVVDFTDSIYPLNPLVHLPSFKASIIAHQAEKDRLFFSLVTAICSLVAALLPRRFLDYQLVEGSFSYRRPTDFVRHCEHVVISLRDHLYFEEPSPEKFAIAFMLGQSMSCIGANGRAMIYWAEAIIHLRRSGIADQNVRSNWNCIETQLWKKMFWISHIVQV
jgi:hypothetical protein